MTESIDVAVSAGRDDVIPVTPQPPTSGRVAIPIGKRPYLQGFDEAPGKNKPVDYDASEVGASYKEKSGQRFTTYTVYLYDVYEYNTWDDYKNAASSGSLTEKVASFELCYDAQMWSGKRLNPDILREDELEVTIRATNKAGKQRDKPKFALILADIDLAEPDGFYRETYKVKGKKKSLPTLRYGKLKKNRTGEHKKDRVNRSKAICVHRWGPRGSEGCATTPNRQYGKWYTAKSKNEQNLLKKGRPLGLWEFEADMKRWMNLTDPKRPGRLVLPGKSLSYAEYSVEMSDWSEEAIEEFVVQ